MNPIAERGAWPTFALEFSRYILRRHGRLAVAILAITAFVAVWSGRGQSAAMNTILTGVAFYAPVMAGLLAMSGIVSDERESGLVLFWFQKPGTLFRAYCTRYAAYQVVLAMFAVTVGILLGIVGTATGAFTALKSVRVAFAMIPLAVLPAAIVFAFSAWNIKRDAVIALLVIIASMTMGAAFVFDRTLLSRVVMTVVFPLDAFQAIGGSPAGGLTRPILIIAGQIAAWTGIGLIGLRQTERALKQGR